MELTRLAWSLRLLSTLHVPDRRLPSRMSGVLKLTRFLVTPSERLGYPPDSAFLSTVASGEAMLIDSELDAFRRKIPGELHLVTLSERLGHPPDTAFLSTVANGEAMLIDSELDVFRRNIPGELHSGGATRGKLPAMLGVDRCLRSRRRGLWWISLSVSLCKGEDGCLIGKSSCFTPPLFMLDPGLAHGSGVDAVAQEAIDYE